MFEKFEAFPKIPRLERAYIVTEKIDGTNASVWVDEEGTVRAASRNRFLTPDKAGDNFGFARWVLEHEDELREKLGIGVHYGEWWGAGIQRRYGLDEKRFSLFNVHLWLGENDRPACCHVVPVLREGTVFNTTDIVMTLEDLEVEGSSAAPGFMQPEGVVVYHVAARQLFKLTLDGDAK